MRTANHEGAPPQPSWIDAAFHALHDLTLDLGEHPSPGTLASAMRKAIAGADPVLETAIWWSAEGEVQLLAGDPPAAMHTLCDAVPEHLCLIHHGGTYGPELFGLPDAMPWRFVPITDRRTLFGWLGIRLPPEEISTEKLSFFCSIAATIGGAHARARAEAARLAAERHRAVLSRYFSPAMTEQVLAKQEVERQIPEATCVVLDLRDFTRRVFSQAPEEIARELNAFFARAIRIIFDAQGVVDKLMGDGILFHFGLLSAEPPGAARRAVKTATHLVRMTDAFNDAENPRLPYRINLGLSTGPVHLGDLGGGGFFDLTVIGRPVNLASRLQTMARDLQVDFLMDEATAHGSGRRSDLVSFPDQPVRGLEARMTLLGAKIDH